MSIFNKLQSIIEESCDIDKDEITPEKTLIDQLEIDSIDLMDIIYAIEREYNIQLEIANFEKVAQSEIPDHKFQIDGIVTAEGLMALKKLMPEVAEGKIKEGLSIHKIPYLFTVQSLCNLIEKKLDKND